jgi:hypothetical protein
MVFGFFIAANCFSHFPVDPFVKDLDLDSQTGLGVFRSTKRKMDRSIPAILHQVGGKEITRGQECTIYGQLILSRITCVLYPQILCHSLKGCGECKTEPLVQNRERSSPKEI